MNTRTLRSKWTITCKTAAIAGLGLAILSLTPLARAGHSESYVAPGAPFNGEWNQYDFAPPASHHTPWSGHWATDYYQYSGVQGKFWADDPNGGATSGYVSSKGSSCSGNSWAGWAYKFDLVNAQGTRGWYLLAHVSDIGTDPFNPYQLYEQSTVYDGTTVGWVAFWGNGAGVPAGIPSQNQCYAVNYDMSNHFHVELGQSIGSSHYACYYNYGSSYNLYAQDWLGLVGANTSTWKGAC